MAATTETRDTKRYIGDEPIAGKQKGSTTLLQGTFAVWNAGYLAPGTTATGLVPAGRVKKTSVNAGADGAVTAEVEPGIFRWENGDSIVQADVGKRGYVGDNQTVYKDPTGRSLMGLIVFVDALGVWVATGPHAALASEDFEESLSDFIDDLAAVTTGDGAALVGIEDAAAYYTGDTVEEALAELGPLRPKKRTVTIGHADLTDNDTSQTVNIGATLPANARIIGHSIRAVTAFAGGTVSALAVDIGTSGDIDAIVDGADLFAAAVDGQAATMPAGISPNKLFASAGAQLIATVVSTGDNLVNLTAGAMTIDVFFIELA